MTPSHLRTLVEDAIVAAIPEDVQQLVILPVNIPGPEGICIGSGHVLAAAHGRPGAVAVRVNVSGLMDAAAEVAGHECEMTQRILVTTIAIHEVAHSLTYRIEQPLPVDEARQHIAACDRLPVSDMKLSHHQRWAAITLVIASRMEHADIILPIVREDIRRHGVDPEPVEQRIMMPPSGASIRDWFSPGSPAFDHLVSTCQQPAAAAA